MLFVTSRKMWARLSRVLVVVLLAVLLAGTFLYVQNNNKPKSADAAPPQPAAGKAHAPALAGVPAAPSGGVAVASPSNGAISPAPAGGQGNPVMLQPLPPIPPGPGGKAITAEKASTKTSVGTPPAAAPAAPRPAALPKPAAAAPLSAVDADKLLTEARAKLEAGELVAARNLLNDAIVAERFPVPAAEQARALQARANEKLVFSPQPFNGDTYSEIARVEQSRGLTSIARAHAVPWEALCRINGVSDKRIRLGQQLKAPVGPFHVMVTKAEFRLDLFLGGLPGEPGSLFVTSLPVGLGKDNSTPTGLWAVAPGGKMKNPTWTNPRSGEHYDGYDPKNPLGGYWIAIKGEEGDAVGKTGYGIHGTIEPDSIGKQASMGCVRLKVEDVQLVYDLLTDKSRVLVRD